MPLKVVGLGAGGHAKVVIEILQQAPDYHIVGLLDTNPLLVNTSVLHVPVLGNDSLMPDLVAHGVTHFFIGLGGELQRRRLLYEWGLALRLKSITAIQTTAVISPSSIIGMGVTVMAHAVVNAEARVGENVIVNTGAIVEHDCLINNHVHIAPGACLAGGVIVGEQSFVGMGALVRPSVRIGERAVIGAGAVVVKDVDDGQIVVGNPARPLVK